MLRRLAGPGRFDLFIEDAAAPARQDDARSEFIDDLASLCRRHRCQFVVRQSCNDTTGRPAGPVTYVIEGPSWEMSIDVVTYRVLSVLAR